MVLTMGKQIPPTIRITVLTVYWVRYLKTVSFFPFFKSFCYLCLPVQKVKSFNF
jgi:hypothetical protein